MDHDLDALRPTQEDLLAHEIIEILQVLIERVEHIDYWFTVERALYDVKVWFTSPTGVQFSN